MKKTLIYYCSLTLAVVFIATRPVYATEIYKCKGTDGSVKFQQNPCGSKNTGVKINSAAGDEKDKKKKSISAEDRILKQKSLADALEQERAIKREERQKKSKERTRAKQNCTRAKDRLATYKNSRGVYHLDKEGRKVYGNEADRQRAIREMQRAVAYWCRKAGR